MDLLGARNLLLCLRYGIGDVVMEIPALEGLRRALPATRITALGAAPALELLEADSRVDELVRVQDFGFSHWGDYGAQESRNRFRQWLEQQGFEAVLDPSHAVMGVGQVIWEKAAPRKFDSQQEQEQALRQGLSGAEAIRRAVAVGWGLELAEGLSPSLQLTPADFSFARRFLAEAPPDRPLLGCSPIASSPLKSWPVARYAAVARRLQEETGGTLLLFTGPHSGLAAEFSRALGRGRYPLLVVGGIHLKKVAALLARCRWFFCNDTGLMHLAAAVGTAGVALFGPTSPAIYLPPGRLTAVGGTAPCPHRKRFSFGPPPCLVQGRCFEESGRCIDRTTGEQVLAAFAGLGATGG